MFATNPIYRWQNFGEFRMLYNAMFNYKSLGLGAPTAKPDEDAGRQGRRQGRALSLAGGPGGWFR